MPRDLNLGYLTQISLPSWAMKTIVPFPEGDQVVILHAFVGLRKTRYQSNNVGSRLEVISCVGKLVALIHMNDIMPHEFQAHLLVESVYVTQDSKQVGRALVGVDPMGYQEVPSHPPHAQPHPPFYESNHGNDDLTFPSVGKPLTRRAVQQGNTLGNVVQGSKPLYTSRGIY